MTVHSDVYKGFNIDIEIDEDPISPRENDNLGTMVCFHNHYDLGDRGHGLTVEEAMKLSDREDVVSLPLYLYDHSGITMNTTGFSCPWDSGQVGFIYVTKEKIQKEYGVKRVSKKIIERIKKYLIGEVEIYDSFIRGEVYCYVVEKDGEHVDSCSGFYNIEECVGYAKEHIDFNVSIQEEQLSLF